MIGHNTDGSMPNTHVITDKDGSDRYAFRPAECPFCAGVDAMIYWNATVPNVYSENARRELGTVDTRQCERKGHDWTDERGGPGAEWRFCTFCGQIEML